jgi:hypothetical protein
VSDAPFRRTFGYQLTATSYGRPAMSCEVVAPATETQDVLWPATALNAAIPGGG